MKRKTVFLDQGEFMGGAEHFLLDFFSALSPTEVRRLNVLVLGGEGKLYQARLPENIERKNFALPAVKGGRISKILALVRLIITAKKLKTELNAQQATQIFSNTPRAHLVVLILKKIWGWKGRWIVMIHDFTTRPRPLVANIGANADIIIANSMPTRSYLKQRLEPKHQAKLRLIENGVKSVTDQNPVRQVMRLINLSRIDKRKGQLYFAEAADLLQDRNPDLEFCIVGDSVKSDVLTQNYETKVRQFAQDRKLENLSFKPSVKNPLKTIEAFDVLVFTPTEPETFGRVVIEAFSRGKLVLAFDQTGPKEILQHYQRWLQKNKSVVLTEPNLLLIEANNSMSLAERIAYFADNPSAVEGYTKYAAEFVAQNYSLEETKKRLLEVLL